MKKTEKGSIQNLHTDGNDNFEMSRRSFLDKAGKAGLLFMLPFFTYDNTFGNSFFSLGPEQKKIKFPDFTKNKKEDGIIGPYGEVKIGKVKGQAVPIYIAASGGLACLDFTTDKWFLKFGSTSDLTSITLTSSGIVYGNKAKPLPYSKDNILKFIENIKKDKNKLRGAMLLRASLATSYIVALQSLNLRQEPTIGNCIEKAMNTLGTASMNCSVKHIFGPVTTLVPELQKIWRTAEEQFNSCYSREKNSEPCKFIPETNARNLCAWGICAGKTFVDVLIGTIEVMVEVTEEVWQDVWVCTSNLARIAEGVWPNPFNIAENLFAHGFDQPKYAIRENEINKGIGLIKEIEKTTSEIGGFIGPFAKCAIEGKWTVMQLDTPLKIGGKNTLPYGIKVCINNSCANKLTLNGMMEEAGKAWGETLAILAVLQPSLGLGSIASQFLSAELISAITSAMAGAGEVAVMAATVVIAWVLIALYYATVVSAQLEWKKRFAPDDFRDGICIEHPTFAVALVTLISAGTTPAVLIPPIVTS